MAKRKVLETGVVNLGKWGHKELWDYEIFEDEQGQKRKYIMRPGRPWRSMLKQTKLKTSFILRVLGGFSLKQKKN